MQYVIQVQNVKCGGCAATIQNALQEMAGVQAVSVDVGSGTVQVEADPAVVAKETVVVILASLGYPELT